MTLREKAGETRTVSSRVPLNEGGVVRPEPQRPTFVQVIHRGLAVSAVTAVAVVILAALLDGLSVDRPIDALLAGAVIGLLNALVWPALASLVAPLSVLTLGLGALVLNALLVGLLLDALPGIHLDGISPFIVAIALTVLTTLLAAALALDDDAWFDEHMARRARRKRDKRAETDTPGIVFVQIDGLAEAVFRRAIASGDVPTLHRWLRSGSHRLVSWETAWSSQTGVSQCGILHGTNVDMPAFRWLEKSTGKVLVSNRPASAAEIQQRHSNGFGLLAVNGSSYGNLFSGDAERAVLTMSNAGKTKEGRIGAGYTRYFSRPAQVTRTFLSTLREIRVERRSARDQVRRGVEPRVDRGWEYAFLRAFTTIISRDVCVAGIINDVTEGRSAIYVDFLGYDEVSHHSGPERADSLAVLRDLDRQIARIEKATKFAPRPYKLVVLSDHGQTQGTAFADRFGEPLTVVVERLMGDASSGDDDAEAGRTESSAWLRGARGTDEPADKDAPPTGATVLASGNLALIYLPGPARRLTLQEIDSTYPQLVAGLLEHPGIGFILVHDAEQGPVVLGRTGRHVLGSGEVVGDDPLALFGANAAEKVLRADGYSNVADLMVNSIYDPVTNEVCAFEAQVGSHGGLGGPQTHPFLLYPADLSAPTEPIDGAVAIHRILKSWLAEVGQPVVRPWIDQVT